MSSMDTIAIIGVGCKFPGADNVDEFWNVLKNGENHVKEIPKERWNVDAFYDPDPNVPGKTYAKSAGLVHGLDEWDHRLYGINDMEAELVDPQQRLVLDCVHMAMEDAGITRQDVDGTDTAVYIGSMTDDYKGRVLDGGEVGSAYSVTGTHNSIISARVSYVYNLHGTSIVLDTACSSSLVAIDTASQAISSGRCSTAICGGVNVILDPSLFIALSKAGMLSRTGQCKAFAADADGYTRGEGCGVVIIKSLSKALKDGNKIWGTIKTGTNQDGHVTSPITAPAGRQQENLIEDVYRRYGMEKSNISVIEAHGTGTPIGDPTEVEALGAHFGTNADPDKKVFLGSVKTNIGHLEAAAGIAGLIKTLLMMKHETIVPSLWYHKENENPKLKLDSRGFVVPTMCISWPEDSNHTRVACVNSFGFGGTNAHAIVEQYKTDQLTSQDTLNIDSLIGDFIVCMSANDLTALSESVKHVHNSLEQNEYNLHALSYTSTCRRDHMLIRKAIRGRTKEEIISACGRYLATAEAPEYSVDEKKIVFVFCGVGTAWNGMCSTLMKLDVFRKAIEEIDMHLKPLADWTISDKFVESYDILSDPCLAHIAIFACQVGLVALWKQFGIEPSLIIGQSVGEVAAAYVGGYLDLQDAVSVIFYRSKFLSQCKTGQMAVIRNLEVNIVAENCESIGSVYIAVFNSPSSCTVSGDLDAIKQLEETLISHHGDSFDMIYLDVECAYHTKYVAQAADELEQMLTSSVILKSIDGEEGTVRMVSTVTGQTESSEVLTSAQYWANNVRRPVLYSDAVRIAGDDLRSVVFLEIGPSPTLHAHIGNIFTETHKHFIFPTMKKQKDMETLQQTMCSLYEIGLDINWKALIPLNHEITDIPRYHMNKYKLLYESPSSVMRAQGLSTSGSQHMFVKQLPDKGGKSQFKVDVDTVSTPFVFEHEVNGQTIIPGAMFADIGFVIATQVMGYSSHECTISLEFLRPTKIDSNTHNRLHISTIGQLRGTLFHVKQKNITMCKGFVKPLLNEAAGDRERRDIESLSLSITKFHCTRRDSNEMYKTLQSLGFSHGPRFRLMNKCITNSNESLTEVHVPQDTLKEANSVTIHPCILDAMMQSTINVTNEELFNRLQKEKLTFLPVAIGELSVFNKPEERMYVYTKRINTTILESVFQIHYNVCLLSQDGLVIADLQNYTTYSKRNGSNAPCELRYKLEWQPHPIDKTEQTENKTKPNILVLAENDLLDPSIAMYLYKSNTYAKDGIKEALETATMKFNSLLNVDAIVLLIEEQKMQDIDSNMAKQLCDAVKSNCLLFIDIINSTYGNSMNCPLYVVTQNTQNNPSCINLLGGELWGFIRSVQIEGSHCPITLVDVQPSITDARNELFQFIENTYRNLDETNPEVLIKDGTVYGSQFSKDLKRRLIPELRLEHCLKRKDETSHAVFTTNSHIVQSPFLLEADTGLKPRSNCNNYIPVSVKSVYMHPAEMFPITLESIQGDQGTCDRSREARYHMYGLEYTGSPLSSKASNRELENNYICIFPCEMKTEMFVPKACMVKASELGENYRPGLLLYSMIFWRLADKIKKRSTVMICCEQRPMERTLLTEILKYCKKAIIVEADIINRDAESRTDVMITLEKFDLCSSIHRQCHVVICQHDNLPETARLSLSKSGKTKVDTYDVASLLDRKRVAKCLPKVSKWLKKFLEDSKSDTVTEEIPLLRSSRLVNLVENSQFSIPVRTPVAKLFTKAGSYVVTGGLTGLGWEITKQIAEMGAGNIVLMSRRKPTLEQKQDIEAIEGKSKCTIVHTQADVTDIHSVLSSFEGICSKTNDAPIRGIFHCAGVLKAAMISDIEEQTLDIVLAPKVKGIFNMHIATKGMNLDYFVVSSSVNSVLGSLGQASYAAANSVMDSFIQWRRQSGLPGQSINWGALSVGMGNREEFSKALANSGNNLLSVIELQSCLVESLMHNSTNCIYTNTTWEDTAKDYSNRQRMIIDILLEQSATFVTDVGSTTMAFDLEVLQNADRHTRLQALNKVVRFVAGKVVGGDMNALKGSATLSELGFDSMSSVTFVSIVHNITGHRLGAATMADTGHSLDDVVQAMYDGLFNSLVIPKTAKVASS